MRSRPLWLLAVSIVLTLAVGIAAYATRDERTPPKQVPTTAPSTKLTHGPEYVAIGDSFTAGGPIGALQAGAEDCVRSRQDYPTQVAKAVGLSLTDVSCGGATTNDVLNGKEGVAAQLDAVTRKAKLVTVSIGGNDHGIYLTAFVNCLRLAKANPAGAPCQGTYGAAFDGRLPVLQQSVTDVIAGVQERAPKARVMVVTYLRLLPDGTECPELPYPTGDVAWVTQVERKLSDVMREAAASRGVEVIDMHTASEGHDVCSDEPWTNGLRPKQGDGWFLHPNAAGTKAVADEVIEAWREGPPEQR